MFISSIVYMYFLNRIAEYKKRKKYGTIIFMMFLYCELCIKENNTGALCEEYLTKEYLRKEKILTF